MSEKLTIPTGQPELEEMLGDQQKVQQLMASGQFNEVVKAYAGHVAKADSDMTAQIKEQTQAVLAEYLRENGQDLNRLKGGADKVAVSAKAAAHYNPKASGAKLDGEFEGLGEFFQTIWHRNEARPQFQAKLEKLRNAAANSSDPSAGGFLIPEAFRAELLSVALETSVVRPRARVVPMESPRVLYPTVDATSNVNSVHGGIIAEWTSESGSMTDTAAKFGRISLDAWKLTAFANVPNELIQDSAISFEQFISTAFPEALAYYEDDAFITGTGAGQPKGYLNADALVSVAKESGQAADTVVWENVVKMYARMLPGSLNRAVWVVSPSVLPQLFTMGLAVGTGGSAIYVQNGTASPPMSLLGRPVIVSEKVPQVGDANDITFVDFSYYLIGDRQQITADSSPHFRFQNGETSFRVVSRVDGRPWLQSAITPRNGGDTLSPIIGLAERA